MYGDKIIKLQSLQPVVGLTVLLFLLMGCMGFSNQPGNRGGDRGMVAEEHIYSVARTEQGAMILRLNSYKPQQQCTSRRPTVLYIHAGAFVVGDRHEGAFRGHAQLFTESGFNFVSIDYRLIPHRPLVSNAYRPLIVDYQNFPESQINAHAAAMQDTIDAMRWVEASARQLCHDPGNIILFGGSSGAITALNLAYSLDDFNLSRPAIRAVIADCGAYLPNSVVRANDIPAFLIHGRRDPVIPVEESEKVWQQIVQSGTRAQIYTYSRAGHCVNLHRSQVDGTPLTTLMVDFARNAALGQPVQSISRHNL